MSSAPAPTSPPLMQTGKLAVLLDALDGVVLSDAERASLAWLAGFEAHTVENVAAVISCAGCCANSVVPRGVRLGSRSRSTDKIGHEGV